MSDPIVSQLLQKSKRVQAQKNKRMGKAYEQRILSQINAIRVPMSGAGPIKGDGLLQTPYGLAVLECKYRHDTKVRTGATRMFAFETGWLDKLEKDVDDMRAVFGILIMHLAGDRFHYGVISKKVMDTLVGKPPTVYGSIEVNKAATIRTVGLLEPICRNGVMLLRVPRGEYYIYDLFYLLRDLGVDTEEDDATAESGTTAKSKRTVRPRHKAKLKRKEKFAT